MVLKQYMIILIMLMSLVIFSCGIDVPATAPELTETLKTAKDDAAAKTDEVTDVKTIEANTEASAIVEKQNKQEEK